jgi:pimeloyl-ACP methyl ester carboxylesterase
VDIPRFVSKASLDGVTERLFTLGEIPAALWTPEDARGTRPLVLMGHGGGQHKKAPGIVARAHRFAAEGGFAVAAIDVPNHGGRPTSEEFDQIAAEYRARAAAGEDTTALNTAMYTLVVGQTVAEWQAAVLVPDAENLRYAVCARDAVEDAGDSTLAFTAKDIFGA